MSSYVIIRAAQIIWQSSCKQRTIFPSFNLAAEREAKEKIKETLTRLFKI